ncbi:MAG: argininosuccinate lyase, partial [Clostridiales bacterium]|nr:argininosuccinate lyase [Clostridiales bacterium]
MKLWAGRFSKSTDAFADHFQSSLSFDKRLIVHDIKGSIAHAHMLAAQNIISEEDGREIEDGLSGILEDYEDGRLELDDSAEDIHMAVEALLTKRIGEAGKKLHTGRSRNDQVALDMRLYAMSEIDEIIALSKELMRALLDLSKKHTDTVMPGYTHLQRAQPVTFAHHLLAYVEMLKRDIDRLLDAKRRTSVMPLGSGALAASTYPLNRELVRELLDFDAISYNSMDAVSDRDFLIELLSAISMIMMHLSRLCEEIALWSSWEFKFIELDD